MGKIEKNSIFIQNANPKDRMIVFRDNLKRHLSNEYLYLTDKKDDLENQVLQLKIEREQKDKTLFQTLEKKDIRKYFSPLNLSEIEEDQKDEKQKQLSMNMERYQEEIDRIEQRINEIRDFLSDIDELISEDRILLEEDKDSELKINLPVNLYDEDEENENINDNNILKKKNGDSSFLVEKEKKIYPQLLRNLYELSDVLQENNENLDVLIEFNDNNIELDSTINKNIIRQLEYNINLALEDYEISMVLIQGTVNEEAVDVCLSYMCESGKIDTMKISYFIQRT